MKKQILKIAGVKSEKEFYKKFPTEEAFMAKHGKELKKAQIGAYMTSESASTMYQPIDVRGIYDEIDYQLTGMTAADRAQIEAAKQAAAQSSQSSGGGAGGGGGIDMSQLAQFAEMAGGAKKGKKIPKAQPGRVQTGGLPRTQLGNVTGAQPGLPRTQLGNVTDRGPMPIPSATPTAATTKQPVNWAQGIPIVGKIVGGIQKSKEAKKLLQQTIQQEKLTDVMGQAAASRPVQQPRRQYVRPEDMAFQPEQMFPSYGVGTNVLAEFGASVGGGEIMNTFAPNTLYDNLGYEPLNDSERYKQFYHGGKMHKAQTGLETFMNQQGGNEIFGTIDQLGAFNDGGGDIGSGIGEAVGSFIPGAGPILSVAGRIIGSALDQKKEKTEASQERTTQNINEIVGQNVGMGVQQQFGANMEDGGMTSPYKWVSHTWQPQVIASFGGHNVKDLLKPPHDADMLRAGGHLKAYTPPSAAAMSTERPVMQMGGELQTHWGGYAEPMSYNPYLPDGGETIMFRGQSHDESDGRGNTGIGITYGENPVEVERGEPAVKLQDGTSGDSSLVVFGNLKIPKSYLPFLGEEAKGKKFKTYVADLSKKENKQNKKLDKATQMLEDFEVSTPIDKMTLNSLQYTMLGANQKLKELADKKMTAASLQNAINDTAQEMGLVADDLARGKVKIDKEASKETAQGGKKLEKIKALPTVPKGQTKGDVFWGNVTQADFEAMKARNPWYDWKNFDPSSKADVKDFQIAFNKEAQKLGVPARLRVDGAFGEQTVSAESLYGEPKSFDIPSGDLNIQKIPETAPEKETVAPPIVPITPYKRNPLLDVIGQVLPYIRPTDMEELDPRQLIGEMYALGTNQLEPVQAQTIQPQLSVPYDISLQDILNENEATFRSQQRLMGYNPAAQSQLNAQKYAANQKVLAEQFRLNQAEKQRVYEQNRNLLNQFGLQNLAILDRQYERQEKAKSITKGTNLEALKSIGDKFMRNQLSNRTLATAENLYNFRYDPRFRAINMNAPFQPQIPTVYTGPDGKQYQTIIPNNTGVPSTAAATDPLRKTVPAAAPSAPAVQPFVPLTDQELDEQVFTAEEIEEQYKRGGRKGITVSKKKSLNSSVVKAFKNL